ncbi:MAG: DUF934 domain-containing protein [Pseudomonadota bacterium]
MKLIASSAHQADAQGSITIANDADPRDVSLDGVTRIDLHFPKFTDGRAFSQAFLLSRRLGFKGEIRATGDVLVDQLAQMERSGFTTAVLRADQDMAVAERVLGSYPGYQAGKYQGDAVEAEPHFAQLAHLAHAEEA